MKDDVRQLQISGRPLGEKNKEDFDDIFAALELLGIDSESFVKTMGEIDNLPLHLWIHDEEYAIVYGNDDFVDTYGGCMHKSCFACLMGEQEACSCCLSRQALSDSKIQQCTLCRRNNRGYGIKVFHTPVTGSDGQKYIIKSCYYLAQNEAIARRIRQKNNAGAPEALFMVMCSACKRVRDKHNNWLNLDAYFIDNHNVRISHGICPDCTQILYQGLLDKPGYDNPAKK